jgi:vacuolar-type H+-ATPase subunit H
MTTDAKVPITDVEAALLRANALYVVAMSKKAEVAKVDEAIQVEREKANKAFESAMARANTALATAREKAEDARDAATADLGDRATAAQQAASEAWNDLVQYQAKFFEETGHTIDLTSPPRERKTPIRL